MKTSVCLSLLSLLLLICVNSLTGQTALETQPEPVDPSNPPMESDTPSLNQLPPELATPSQLSEETEYPEGQPYIGVRVDHRPLPQLLIKHLGLEEGQGIIIQNIQRDAPADKAELERDDIILSYEGETITDSEQFVQRISEGHIGQEVNMMILHLGHRKSVSLKLAAQADFIDRDDQEDWKYPFRLTGQMERLNPVGDAWRGVNVGIDPSETFNDYLRSLDNMTYAYRSEDGLENFEVTIEGDPFRNKVEIVVRTDEEEFRTTADEMYILPEEYQDAARNALNIARASFLRIGPDGPPPARMWLRNPYLFRVPEDTNPATRQLIAEMETEIQVLQRRLVELEREIEYLQNQLHNTPQPTPPESIP
ncbi:MAG: PDZ domain-containing protein [Sedimentisphaerales bacterium]|nr:PDZ domain-containing protein [Sedimentisphaerales bacterium]